MFNSKKGRIMRHPYVTLAVVGLAAVGAVSIGEKVKGFCCEKTKCVSNMLTSMKENKNDST